MGRIADNWNQRASETTTFRADLRVIPRGLIRLLIGAYGVALAVIAVLVFVPQAIPDPLVGEPVLTRLALMFGVVTAGATVVSAYLLLLGYIAGDAKRRGMRPVLWVLLGILVPYLIGVILYFVLREPLPYKCPQCGGAVIAQFNFCPSCKFSLRPNCPQCRLGIRPGARFCPHCGFALPSDAPARAGA